MTEIHQERHQGATQVHRSPRFIAGADLSDPREILDAQREPRVMVALGSRDAKLVVGDRGEVGIERAREVWLVVEESEERLCRCRDVAAPGVVRTSVDVALEVACLAREATEAPLALVPRSHEGGEE